MQSQSSFIQAMNPSRAVQKPTVAQSPRQDVVDLTSKPAEKSSGLWESKSFGLADFIDMINPLQHLPVISLIYRKITGDEMGNVARVVGGTLFGGLMGNWISGLASSLANAFVSETTGKDIGDHIMAASKSLPVMATSNQPVELPPPAHTAQITPAPQPVAARLDVGPALPVIPDAYSAKSGVLQYQRQIIVDDLSRDTDYWV